MGRSRAIKAFQDFSGHNPDREYTVRLPDEDQYGWRMGPAVGVAYEAKRDGVTERYFHEFKKSARPDLIASDDGKSLYFAKGRFKVTERGIEDMPLLAVVNPSKRPSLRRGMSANPVTRKRKKAPMAMRRRKRTKRATSARRVIVVNSNPIKRHRRRKRRSSVMHMRRNPSSRRRRIGGALRAGSMKLGSFILPAIGIAGGAVLAEAAMGALPIPANLKTGMARPLTKGAVGIVGGMVIAKVLRQPRIGKYFALGAVVIAAHDFMREFIVKQWPAVQFGAYGPALPGFNGVGAYTPALPGFGYTSAGQMQNMGGMAGGAPYDSSDGYTRDPNFRA